MIARLAYLKVILPRHVSVNMSLRGTVDGSSLPLERRFRAIVIMRSWPLPFFHLDSIRCRKGDGSGLDEGHGCHGPGGQQATELQTKWRHVRRTHKIAGLDVKDQSSRILSFSYKGGR